MTRDQKNPLSEPSPQDPLQWYSLGYHRHDRTMAWSSFFCPFPSETALILIVVSLRPRWLMASPLRCGPRVQVCQAACQCRCCSGEPQTGHWQRGLDGDSPILQSLSALGSCLSSVEKSLYWRSKDSMCLCIYTAS